MTFRRVFDTAKEAFAEWQADNGPILGAALAYYSIFALGPLLLIMIVTAGVVLGREHVQTEVFRQLSGVLGNQGANAVGMLLQHAFKSANGLLASGIAVVALLFSASGLFRQVKTALDIIWDAPPPSKRGWLAMVWNQVTAILMVAAAGIVLLATVVLSTVVTAMQGRLAAMMPAVAAPLWHVPQLLITFAAATVLFSLVFAFLPSVHIERRDAWTAGAVTAALFTLGELAIGAYLAKAAPGSVYGAAGSLLVVMVWAYYSAQVFYFGAELTKVIARRQGHMVSIEPVTPPAAAAVAQRAQSFSSRWLRRGTSSKR